MSEPPARFKLMIQAYQLLHEALSLTTSAEEQAALSELLTTLAQLSRPLFAEWQDHIAHLRNAWDEIDAEHERIYGPLPDCFKRHERLVKEAKPE
jgi:hypothetical protein